MACSPIINDVLSRLKKVRRSGEDSWKACCPAHDDQNPSLTIGIGDDGRVLVKCYAGCAAEDVCRAAGLTMGDLFPKQDAGHDPRPVHHEKQKKLTKTYPTCNEAVSELESRNGKRSGLWTYHNASGEPVGAVVRWDRPDGSKDIRPVSRRSDGLWYIGAMPEPRLLYRLPDLSDAEIVFVCEGEKAADAAKSLGLTSTTSSGGANAAGKTDWSPLAGKQVIILPDADEPGERYAEEVIRLLSSLTPTPTIKVIRLPGLPAGGDIVEWIEAGGTLDELLRLVEAAEPIEPEPAEEEGQEPWPELIPFVDSALPDFPADALPGVLRDWVEAVSESVQVPTDMPALLSLAVCSFCVSRKVEINGGWFEPTNLYVAVLMPPGSRKSAVFTECLSPLERLEAALQESERETVARAQADRRMKEKTLAKLEGKAASGDQQARHEAIDLASELATEPVPVLPRLLADNATSERLESLLAEQGERIMSASAEGGVFDVMSGKYSKSGTVSIDVYLKGHAGDSLRTDRVGRESVRIDKPTLTLAYAIQPAVIEGLSDNRSMAGRGLWARFLWAKPVNNVGSRSVDTDDVPEPVRQAYDKTVERLYFEAEEGTVLTLSPGAAKLFREWRIEAEAMKREGAELESIVEWGSKLEGATLRIAAVLHSVEYGPKGEVRPETMKSAILIARYLIPHAEAVLTMASAASKVISDAQYVWRWIVRQGKESFSKSEAQHHGKRRFPKANDIDAPLIELQRRGYIRRSQGRQTGPGRPTEEYEVNPIFYETESVQKRSQYSRNSLEESDEQNIGNKRSAIQDFQLQQWDDIEL